MNFIWDPKYSVGIKSIDTQHQRFFEIINRIYSLIHNKYFSGDDLLTVVKDLDKYADVHLTYEEKIFQKFNYPDAGIHIAAHNVLRQKIRDYLTDIRKPGSDPEILAADIAEFTKNWLSQHILDLDHKYISFFILHDIK